MTNSKIKLLIGLPALSVGGIERQLINQLKLFDRDRFDIYVVTLFNRRFKLDNAPSLYSEAAPYAQIHKLDFMGPFDIASWFGLWRLLRKIRPDIVLTGMFSANAVFRILQPLCGYKAIPCEHNTYTDRKIYHRIADHILSYFSYKVVAVSEGVKEYIVQQSKVNPNKIAVIHNGIDLDQAKTFMAENVGHITEIKKKLGFDEKEKIILSVGRLKLQKNQKLLIDAFAIFYPDHPEYKLVIVGRGNEQENLREQIRTKGLAGKVTLAGLRDDVNAFYMASDMFVLTSSIEGFALVGIEAMAFGLPMVSTRVAGPVEYVKDGQNGFLADSTPEDVAQKIHLLAALSSAAREDFRHKCLETAEGFSIKKNVAEYERLFDEIFVMMKGRQ